MKNQIRFLVFILYVIFLPALASAQKTAGPWDIYTYGAITVFKTEVCRVEVDDEKQTLTIQTRVPHPVEGPNAYIAEEVGIRFNGTESKLVYQKSWYENKNELPGVQRRDRGLFTYDEKTQKVSGKLKPYLFDRLKDDFVFLPDNLKLLIPKN